jgi:outer membrane receptor protein involved in Fe transport
MKKIYLGLCLLPLLFSAQNDSLSKGAVNLKEVIVSDRTNNNGGSGIISHIDKQLRPANSAQDLLQLIPGLFIAQHAGGGKAEQIFFRGFDSDHGTDFSVNIDGMPVNMVSHAHGQGYADFHFVIPETVDKLKVYKGPYTAAYGDFATSGAGEFSTKNSLEKSQVKLEGGIFNTYRAVAMTDLLQGKHLLTRYNENFYVAGEYNFSNSYFESKQNFKRYNIFAKYSAQLNENNFLNLSGSNFNSGWDASGQIPERAVSDGVITRFGSIDNTEGGTTGRTTMNAILTTGLKNGGVIKNQAFYNHYHFNLYSNFTFFLNDSVNGDQITQTEKGRNIYGYKFTYEKNHTIAGKLFKTTVGAGTRVDDGEIALKRSVKRVVYDTICIGRVTQQNASAYIDETVFLTDKFSVNASLRFDYFDFRFRDFQFDSASGRKQVPKVSPKLNLHYDVSETFQLYARTGLGFHSNDARSVVLNQAEKSLPTAFGYEIGSTFKLGKRTLVNAALWGLELENELVYVGDEAVVEITGATRRLGADLSVRYQITKNLFADADINYNYGRYKDLPKNENFIPLAPALTGSGGLSYKLTKGWNCALRYKHMAARPANENNTVTAKGFFLMDAVINYASSKFLVGLSAENILNTEWNQAQFDTRSRLTNESQPVSELHYTPGTPFFLKGSVTFFF